MHKHTQEKLAKKLTQKHNNNTLQQNIVLHRKREGERTREDRQTNKANYIYT